MKPWGLNKLGSWSMFLKRSSTVSLLIIFLMSIFSKMFTFLLPLFDPTPANSFLDKSSAIYFWLSSAHSLYSFYSSSVIFWDKMDLNIPASLFIIDRSSIVFYSSLNGSNFIAKFFWRKVSVLRIELIINSGTVIFFKKAMYEILCRTFKMVYFKQTFR